MIQIEKGDIVRIAVIGPDTYIGAIKQAAEWNDDTAQQFYVDGVPTTADALIIGTTAHAATANEDTGVISDANGNIYWKLKDHV